MKLCNTSKSDLGLPNRVVIPAGGSATVSDEKWEAVKSNKVVLAWLESCVLAIGEPDELPPPLNKTDENPELDALRAEAEKLGIHVSARWGEKRIVEEIAKVKTDENPELDEG